MKKYLLFVLLTFFVLESASAADDASLETTKLEIRKMTCDTYSVIAERARNDHMRGIPLKTALPFYYRFVEERFAKGGMTPIIDTETKLWIDVTAKFMYDKPGRTVNDYMDACLQKKNKP